MNIDGVSCIVEQNSAATEEMAANRTQLSQAVEKVSVIAEQNRAATVDVSTSAGGLSAQVQQVIASAQSLDDMAKGLQEAVSIFKLDDGRLVTSRARVEAKEEAISQA